MTAPSAREPRGPSDDLRVLVVHNRYRSGLPSGENRAVDREIDLLRRAGVGVSTLLRSSDSIDELDATGRAVLPLRPFWSLDATRELGARIAHDRPQVVHLHNPYPLISPAVVRTAKRRGLAVVQTVHNYRHSCLNGLHLRDGEPCTDCLGRSFAAPGVRHGCYRGSRAQSAVLATAERLHRSTWQQVDRFFALSTFTAEHLAASGFDPDRITIKANHVDDPGEPTLPGSGFLFAGRLEPAKGPTLLLEAWEASGLDGTVPLVVAGDGPLRDQIEAMAARMRSVVVTGNLRPDALAERFRACSAVVVPSLCFEGLPTVVIEAFAHGRPVVATAVGALPSTVPEHAGYLTAPDPPSLARALASAATTEKHGAARQVFEQRYRADIVLRQLLEVYRSLRAPAAVADP